MELGADCLVALLFVQENFQLTQKSFSDQLLMVRDHATNKGIASATQKAGLIVHRDKHFVFIKSVIDKQIETQIDVVLQAEEKFGKVLQAFGKIRALQLF
jgi:hypothetical protein